MAYTHDFHYSRLALEWNENTSTWQGILRIFTDDLERALSATGNQEITWRLGDQLENSAAELAIKHYVTQHWGGQLLSDGEQEMAWTYIGKEVDFDLTFIYIETQTMKAPLPLKLHSNGLFELFEDQVNEITLKLNGSSHRELLSNESASVRIDSIAP